MGDLSNLKNMKALLVIALATVATAKPWVYTVGHPYVAPVVYAAPPVVHLPVTNTCKNEAGALVPCAQPAGVVGDSVYAYPDAVHPGFVQHGALATVAAPAADAAAAEDAVVSVEKREAEADPEADADADAKSWWYGYYGHPYGYYGHHGYYGHFYGAYGHPWYGYYAGVGCRNGYGALVPCAHGR